MGTRTRLFASAAFPLLSLSLILQPAHAAMLQSGGFNAGARPSAGAASFEIAQAAPEPAQDEQDPHKKKKPQGEEQGQPAEAPKPPKAAEPEAPKPPKAAEPEAPKPPKAAEPEAPKPPKAAEPEAPKPPKAPEPEAPKPPRAAEPAAPAAAESEAPKPPKHDKKAPAAEPAEELGTPKPAPEPAAPAAQPEAQPQGNKHKPKDQVAPAAEQPATPSDQPAVAPGQPQKHHQKPANGETQPAAPQAEPAAPAAPAATPAKPPKPAAPAAEAPAEPVKPAAPAAPNAEIPAAPKAEGEKPPVKPEGLPKPGAKGEQPAAPAEPPVPAAPAGKPAPTTPGEKPAPGTPGEKPAPAAPGEKPAPGQPPAPADGKPAPAEAPAAPAQNGAAAPQAAPSTAGEQVSPAELERRKKIAENPAAAGNAAGPVILPVQNGTAVLDSDKDTARHGHHGQPGDGQPAPGGQAPAGQVQGQPAPGQAGVDQRPPAPENVRAPTSDADSQRAPGGKQAPPVKIEAVTSERGQRMDQRPDFAAPDGARIEDRQNNRVIINFGDDVFVRHDDTQRFTRDGERPTYEQLPRDRYRETIGRPDGTQIVTVRNRYGDIIQRSRVDQDGREYVLFYSPELENRPDQDDYYRDPGDQLPPMRLRIPLNQYIIDTSEDQNQNYYDFLRKPPVEPVERVYSLNEVRYSARIRDKVRRIDLDTITFATGSADIPMVQAKTLRGIADGISKIIKKDPSETFLIEGHTDAVGSAQSNLILSDQRAESVANVLTDVYGIPPENLATQGYGEQYLKINTDGPEQENRRVTIRRVTALVRPVAAK